MREHVNEFNHLYWTEQNLRFVEAKRSFVEGYKRRTGGEEPSTGDLNEFYRNFLNENYYNHYEYNQKWIRYNLGLLWSACKVFFIGLIKKSSNESLFFDRERILFSFKQVKLFEFGLLVARVLNN